MILAIGFRVRSKRGTQFRIWANRNLKEYLAKGFVMDDERLKNPDGRPDYFDELLERIREIRASEKRFYQKVRDLFALSSDYDKTDKATQMFLPKPRTSCSMLSPAKPPPKSSWTGLTRTNPTWRSPPGKAVWCTSRIFSLPKLSDRR